MGVASPSAAPAGGKVVPAHSKNSCKAGEVNVTMFADMEAAAGTVLLRLPTPARRSWALFPRTGSCRSRTNRPACPSVVSLRGKPVAFGVLISNRRAAGAGYVDFEYVRLLPT